MKDSVAHVIKDTLSASHPLEYDGLAERSLWFLCGVTMILWGLRLWGYGTTWPWIEVPSVGLSAWGLGLFIWSGSARFQHARRFPLVMWITLILALIALGLWSYTQVLTLPAYGTDEMAFDQFATEYRDSRGESLYSVARGCICTLSGVSGRIHLEVEWLGSYRFVLSSSVF